MKSNSQQIVLAKVTTGADASTAVDVSGGFNGFCLQTIGIAGGGTYVVEGSLDGGATWVDVTGSMKDFGAADAAVTSPIATNSIFEFPARFPGLVRVRCTHTATGTPTAYLNWQDSRQV